MLIYFIKKKKKVNFPFFCLMLLQCLPSSFNSQTFPIQEYLLCIKSLCRYQGLVTQLRKNAFSLGGNFLNHCLVTNCSFPRRRYKGQQMLWKSHYSVSGFRTSLQDFSPVFPIRTSNSQRNSKNHTYISLQKYFCRSRESIHFSSCKGTGKPSSTVLIMLSFSCTVFKETKQEREKIRIVIS